MLEYTKACQAAENALTMFEIAITPPRVIKNARAKENANGYARNLRGTLKNNRAPVAVIQSITDDLKFWTSKM